MEKVYQLKIQIDKINADFYFEEQVLADKVCDAISDMANEMGLSVKMEKVICHVYNKKNVVQEFMTAMEMLFMIEDLKNPE